MISSCKDVLGSDLLSVVIIQGVLRICYVDCIDLREGKVLFFHGSYSFFFLSAWFLFLMALVFVNVFPYW